MTTEIYRTQPVGRSFVHDPVDLVELETLSEGETRYYVLPDGSRFPSVTTVLSSAYDRSWVADWTDRVGQERVDAVMQQARVRGTAVHDLCEKYVRNDPEYSRGHMPSNVYTFTTIRKFLDRRIGTVRAIEAPLYSKRLMTAGRTDLVAEVDGELSIVDYKTGTRIKSVEDIESYFIQATCYGEMFEELTGIAVPRITVVMAPDESPLPIVYARARVEYRERMKEIFLKDRKRQ